MSMIDKVIAKVKYEIEYYSDPGAYQEDSYYIRCDAKKDVLEDLLYYLEQLKEDE